MTDYIRSGTDVVSLQAQENEENEGGDDGGGGAGAGRTEQQEEQKKEMCRSSVVANLRKLNTSSQDALTFWIGPCLRLRLFGSRPWLCFSKCWWLE